MAQIAKKAQGATLAVAAASLLFSGAFTSASADGHGHASSAATVKCSGINSCKGTSACATATSSCKGHNSCKGVGWLEVTAEECKEKGGTVK